MKRRSFLKRCFGFSLGGLFLSQISSAGSLLSNDSIKFQVGSISENPFPHLNHVGDNYVFSLVADPQVGTTETLGSVVGCSAYRYEKMIEEMNNMPTKPVFSIIDGDLINVPTSEASWEVFMERTLRMKFTPILVYGNHDGNANTGYYELFKKKQKICNGTDGFLFSFDCGKIHYVVFPCDVKTETTEGWPYPSQQDIVDWMDSDLRKNRNKPTVVFCHEHLLPQGLTQLEWYTYDREFRKKLLDVLSRYNNVQYVVWGHVHNGVKSSVKTAWSYRGIKYITAPTSTPSRPFGEEFPEFQAGQDQGNGYDYGGGYYLLFDVKGDKITVKARLAEVDAEYVYKESDFRPYTDQEPLWLKAITDYTPKNSLENGSFANGITGWAIPYRYESDDEEMFQWSIDSSKSRSSSNSLFMNIKEVGQPWAQTEMLEAYQWLQCSSDPLLKMSYFLDQEGIGGGGYFRVFAFTNNTMKRLFMFDWNANSGEKAQSANMAKNSYYTAVGRAPLAKKFILMGEAHEAMFWTLPKTLNSWHDLTVNLHQVYDDANGIGAWDGLGINRLLVAVGVWTLENDGSRNRCWFDDVSVTEAAGENSNIDGSPLAVDSSVWYTDFGQNFV